MTKKTKKKPSEAQYLESKYIFLRVKFFRFYFYSFGFISEIFFSFIFWNFPVMFLRNVYFFSLAKTGMSAETLLLASFFIPFILIFVNPLKKYISRGIVIIQLVLYVCSSLIIIENIYARIIFGAIIVVFSGVYFDLRLAEQDIAIRKRFVQTQGVTILFSCILKYITIGIMPMHNFYVMLTFIIVGVFCLCYMCFEEIYIKFINKNLLRQLNRGYKIRPKLNGKLYDKKNPVKSILLVITSFASLLCWGIGFCMLYYFVTSFAISPTGVTNWAGFNFNVSVLVIAAIFVGIFFGFYQVSRTMIFFLCINSILFVIYALNVYESSYVTLVFGLFVLVQLIPLVNFYCDEISYVPRNVFGGVGIAFFCYVPFAFVAVAAIFYDGVPFLGAVVGGMQSLVVYIGVVSLLLSYFSFVLNRVMFISEEGKSLNVWSVILAIFLFPQLLSKIKIRRKSAKSLGHEDDSEGSDGEDEVGESNPVKKLIPIELKDVDVIKEVKKEETVKEEIKKEDRKEEEKKEVEDKEEIKVNEQKKEKKEEIKVEEKKEEEVIKVEEEKKLETNLVKSESHVVFTIDKNNKTVGVPVKQGDTARRDVKRLFTYKKFKALFKMEYHHFILRIVMTFLLIVFSIISIVVFIVYNSFEPKVHSEKYMRVCAFNVYQGFTFNGLSNVDKLTNFLWREKIDVAGLVESNANRVYNGFEGLSDYVGMKTHMNYYQGLAGSTPTIGQTILSNFPLAYSYTLPLPIDPDGIFRSFLNAGVVFNGTLIHVKLVHVDTEQYDESRDRQFQVVFDEIEKLDSNEPVMVIGDFNSSPNTTQYKRFITEGFHDAYFDFHGHHNSTWRQMDNLAPPTTIDFIMYRGEELNVIDARIMGRALPGSTETISDHLAVVVDFTVTKKVS